MLVRFNESGEKLLDYATVLERGLISALP